MGSFHIWDDNAYIDGGESTSDSQLLTDLDTICSL